MQTTRSWLTADQGNSSLDLVWFLEDGERLEIAGSWSSLEVEHLDEVAEATSAQDTLAVMSSVQGAGPSAALLEALEGHWPGAAMPDAGLDLAVETPETTGTDRLLAARAARDLSRGGAAIVVDVGTALTVDLVEDGAFQGGAIAAGPRLLARALGEGGAQLFEIEPRPGACALGKSTRAALEAGVVVGLRGAARGLVEALAAHSREMPEVWVTGGARALLLEPEGFMPGMALREAPHLVHLGLLAAAGGLPTGLGLAGLVREHPSS